MHDSPTFGQAGCASTGLVHTPQQWTDIDRQHQDAIQGRQQAPAHRHGPGDGTYQRNDFTTRHEGLDGSERKLVLKGLKKLRTEPEKRGGPLGSRADYVSQVGCR